MIRGLRWQRGPDLGGVVPGKVQGNVLRPYGLAVSTHDEDHRENLLAAR